MTLFLWIIGSVAGALIAVGCAFVWAAAVTGARADRRSMCADDDEFTPSIDRFGYVQDARNQGDV